MKIYTQKEGGRPWTIYLAIAVECLLGGLLTAWAFSCSSIDGGFNPKAFLLPAVFEISSLAGLFIGALFSPLVYLSMRHLRLRVRAACYLTTILAAPLLELSLGSGFIGSILVLLGLCAVCAFTQRSCDV